MVIFNLSHTQVITILAPDHHRESRIVSPMRVIIGIWVLHINYFIIVRSIADGAEVAVALEYGICFRRNGWVNISI